MQKYADVDAFLEDLDADKREQVDYLRALIKQLNPELTEHIKWNALSYVLDGEDRLTFNLLNKEGVVKLVLHMGATRPEDKKAPPVMADDSGLISWQSDIRGALSFSSLTDIKEKQSAVVDILTRWLAIR